ncbi:MAG TPA: PQQ-binding-like beta-propeller repeat protein [Gemmataceae bacterium]|nr:PQQ-binding-like beta-propeller repeat protein [Gemmataceae bacterium]
MALRPWPAVAFFVISLHISTPAAADDSWPQWRGPARDGSSPGPDWPKSLSNEFFSQTWKVENLGESYSGPIVGGGRVFTTETVDKKIERVRCFDRKAGKELWTKEWDGSLTVPFFAARNGSWIRSTPALDGDSLYVGGIRDVLVCLDVKDGSERWRADLAKDLDAPPPMFGFVASPLVDDTGIYVQAGSSVAKLDKKTGKVLWSTLKEKEAMFASAFASPTFAKLAGKDQLLVQTRSKLVGLDRGTGKVLWEKPIPSFRGMNVLTPVTIGDAVFTATYGGNTRLVSVTGEADKPTVADAWTFKYEGHMTTPVVIDGHVYLFGKDRRFICLDAKTGKEAWRSEQRFGEYWNLVSRGDKILALDSVGKLYLIQADPKKFVILDERQVSKPETWAHLAVVGDEVFIRDLFGLTAYRFAAK